MKHFQKRHGLKADGVAGPATLQALGVRATKASYSTRRRRSVERRQRLDQHRRRLEREASAPR